MAIESSFNDGGISVNSKVCNAMLKQVLGTGFLGLRCEGVHVGHAVYDIGLRLGLLHTKPVTGRRYYGGCHGLTVDVIGVGRKLGDALLADNASAELISYIGAPVQDDNISTSFSQS